MSRHGFPWALFAAVVLSAASPAGAQTPAGDPDTTSHARLRLSWHAPYGTPRASDTLTFACGSMTRVDTLFMSFEPTSASTSYTGFTANLWVKPLAGDSLGAAWEAPDATGLPLWMKLEFAPDSATGCPSPFLVSGVSGAACHRTPDGGRIIRMVHAVGYPDSVPLEAGKCYGLARFIIRQPPRSEACLQPVCIQWLEADIGQLAGMHRRFRPEGVGVVLNPVPGGAGCFEAAKAPAEGMDAKESGRDAARKPAPGATGGGKKGG